MTPQQYIESQNAIREGVTPFGIRTLSAQQDEPGQAVNLLVETGSATTQVATDPESYHVLYISQGDSYHVDAEGRITVQIGGDPDNTLRYEGFSYLVDSSGSRFIVDDDAAEIARLYQVAFGRVPDEAGLEFWLNAYKSGKASIEHIAEEFLRSAEFKANFGELNSLTPESFITLLYNNILDRDPEPAGFAFWVNAVRNGEDPEHIVQEFSRSDENNIKTRDWAINLSDGGYIGENFFISRDDFPQVISDILYGGTFSDLRNLDPIAGERSDFRANNSFYMFDGDGRAQFDEGLSLTITNSQSPFGGKLEIILPDDLIFVGADINDPDGSDDQATTLTYDLIATPSENNAPFLEWSFTNTTQGVRFFLDDTQRDIINPLIDNATLIGNEEVAPPEIHNFVVGQDVIEAPDYAVNEFIDPQANIPELDHSPNSLLLPVLKDVPSDAISIAAALTDANLTYEEVGAVIVQDGFDTDIWFLSNPLDKGMGDVNVLPMRNEQDGNNRVDDYELVLTVSLKNVEVNPGDALIVDDILLPEGDAGRYMNVANIEFDYLFL